MDWASMVMQMYKKWAEGQGYRVTVVDEMAGETAGIKVHLLKTFYLIFVHASPTVGTWPLILELRWVQIRPLPYFPICNRI